MKKYMMLNTVFVAFTLQAGDQKELSIHNYELFCAIRTIKQKAEEAVATAGAEKISATVKLSDFPSVLDIQTKDGLVLDISNKIEVISPWGKIPLATQFMGSAPQALKEIIQKNIFSIVHVDGRKNPPNPQAPTQYKIISVTGHKLPLVVHFDFSHKTDDVKKNMQLWMALDKRYKKEHEHSKL